MTKDCSLRVLVAHERTVSRLGIASLVTKDPDLSVVAQTATLLETREALQHTEPDVVVTGRSLDGASGVDLLTRIAEVATRRPLGLVVLLADACVHDLLDLWTSGGHAVLSEGVDALGLQSAIHMAARGWRVVDGSLAESLSCLLKNLPPAWEDLQEQETRILGLLASGLSNREIALALCLKPSIVRRRLSRLRRDLGLHSRSEAAAWWTRYSLEHPDCSGIVVHEMH